jgi:ABC-type transport system involved in Fe-S cluster assembly fused permease/ATPase subunit
LLFQILVHHEKKVMDAIKFAQLDMIIENFPNKEKTIVGERGV